MDRLTKKARSQLMSKVRSADTKPELLVRRIVSDLKYRYRIHPTMLSGRPDLAITSLRKAIFVHGCFWHQHEECGRAVVPASNIDYWRPKLLRNKLRDRENRNQLRRSGWSSTVVWECELTDVYRVKKKLASFLRS